jgi:hypothetical protein
MIDIDRMEVKMFYLFQNNAQDQKSSSKDYISKKGKKSNHTSSDYSKANSSAASE